MTYEQWRTAITNPLSHPVAVFQSLYLHGPLFTEEPGWRSVVEGLRNHASPVVRSAVQDILHNIEDYL